MSTRYHLDARRLLCPMPVIRVQNRVGDLAAGDILEVRCTDPGTRSDIPAWCRINGHQVLAIDEREGDDEREGEIVITVRVGDR